MEEDNSPAAVSDDKDATIDDTDSTTSLESSPTATTLAENANATTSLSVDGEPRPITFSDIDTISDNIAPQPNNLSKQHSELLTIHRRFGHLSMNRLKWMVKCGIIPKYLQHVHPPMCASCQYGHATRRPWRTKGHQRTVTELRPINQPGDCVSVNQLESPTPGFIDHKRWTKIQTSPYILLSGLRVEGQIAEPKLSWQMEPMSTNRYLPWSITRACSIYSTCT